MRQYAWLDFHGGCWHLVTSNAHDPDRKWMNRETGSFRFDGGRMGN